MSANALATDATGPVKRHGVGAGTAGSSGAGEQGGASGRGGAGDKSGAGGRSGTGGKSGTTGNSAGGATSGSTVSAQTTTATANAAIATMLTDATGYTPSQVTTRAACGDAGAGAMSCDSELLVSKSTGAPVYPLGIGASTGSSATTSQSDPDAYSPAFLQEAYDTGWLTANRGAGQTVAIVDAYYDPYAESDLDEFRSYYGLPAIDSCSASATVSNDSGTPCIAAVNQRGRTNSWPSEDSTGGWEVEESLDLDAVSTMCPECNILFIQTNSDDSSDLAAGNAEALTLGAKYVSDSWGGLGTAADDDDGDTPDYFTDVDDATHDESGAELFAATGDDGAYVDDEYEGQTSDSDTQYPASEPAFTAVGGTSVEPASNGRGYTETAWSGAGSGCATGETEPSWQASADTGCSGRAVADVSADADPDTGLAVYDSFPGDDSIASTYGSDWGIIGGTSLATPLTAAYTALTGVNSDSTANSDGSLSAEWAYADASQLNDVTSGNDGTCLVGTASQLCDAGLGWDGPTGVGSIDGDVLSGGPSLTTPPSDQLSEPDVVPADASATSGSSTSELVSLGTASATFDGGAYPNGSDTTVTWWYGDGSQTDDGTNFSDASSVTSTSTLSGTAPQLAAAAAPVGVDPGDTYYLEECATNSTATVCGNEVSFTAPDSTALVQDVSDPPVISDTDPAVPEQVTAGDTLSVSNGGWYNDSGVTYAYQWYLNGNPISGATSNTYTPPANDANDELYAEVTATAGTSVSVASAAVTVEPFTSPQPSAAPQIVATSLDLGGQLSLETAGWSPLPTSISYQWQESSDELNWSNLGAATSSPSTYTIALTDSDQYIRAVVVATDSAGSTTVDTDPVQIDPIAPQAVGSLTLAATSLTTGGVLSVAGTAWQPSSASAVYQWQESSDGSSWDTLSTDSTYTIQSTDSGQQIRLQVTVSDAGGSLSLTSNTVQIAGASSGGSSGAGAANAAVLSGHSSVGSKLSVSAPSGATVTFERCAHTCKIVQSGRSATYRLTTADAGYFLVSVIKQGTSSVNVTNTIGPITGPTAAAVKLTASSATLATSSHVTLLSVRRTITAGKKGKPSRYRLRLSRNAKLKGSLHAWACLLKSGQLVSCTASVNVSRTATLTETVSSGETAELIAVT